MICLLFTGTLSSFLVPMVKARFAELGLFTYQTSHSQECTLYYVSFFPYTLPHTHITP